MLGPSKCTYQRHCGVGPELVVDVPAALWECWARVTGGRTSGIVGMLGPKVSVRSGHPPRPTRNWWAERRSFATGKPTGIFLTRLVPSSPSHRISTWCRRTFGITDQRGLTSTAPCPRSLYGFPFFQSRGGSNGLRGVGTPPQPGIRCAGWG